MTLLSEYYVPGLHIEDRSIKVPLDWTGHEPGHGFDGESISLFYLSLIHISEPTRH